MLACLIIHPTASSKVCSHSDLVSMQRQPYPEYRPTLLCHCNNHPAWLLPSPNFLRSSSLSCIAHEHATSQPLYPSTNHAPYPKFPTCKTHWGMWLWPVLEEMVALIYIFIWEARYYLSILAQGFSSINQVLPNK